MAIEKSRSVSNPFRKKSFVDTNEQQPCTRGENSEELTVKSMMATEEKAKLNDDVSTVELVDVVGTHGDSDGAKEGDGHDDIANMLKSFSTRPKRTSRRARRSDIAKEITDPSNRDGDAESSQPRKRSSSRERGRHSSNREGGRSNRTSSKEALRQVRERSKERRPRRDLGDQARDPAIDKVPNPNVSADEGKGKGPENTITSNTVTVEHGRSRSGKNSALAEPDIMDKSQPAAALPLSKLCMGASTGGGVVQNSLDTSRSSKGDPVDTSRRVRRRSRDPCSRSSRGSSKSRERGSKRTSSRERRASRKQDADALTPMRNSDTIGDMVLADEGNKKKSADHDLAMSFSNRNIAAKGDEDAAAARRQARRLLRESRATSHSKPSKQHSESSLGQSREPATRRRRSRDEAPCTQKILSEVPASRSKDTTASRGQKLTASKTQSMRSLHTKTRQNEKKAECSLSHPKVPMASGMKGTDGVMIEEKCPNECAADQSGRIQISSQLPSVLDHSKEEQKSIDAKKREITTENQEDEINPSFILLNHLNLVTQENVPENRQKAVSEVTTAHLEETDSSEDGKLAPALSQRLCASSKNDDERMVAAEGANAAVKQGYHNEKSQGTKPSAVDNCQELRRRRGSRTTKSGDGSVEKFSENDCESAHNKRNNTSTDETMSTASTCSSSMVVNGPEALEEMISSRRPKIRRFRRSEENGDDAMDAQSLAPPSLAPPSIAPAAEKRMKSRRRGRKTTNFTSLDEDTTDDEDLGLPQVPTGDYSDEGNARTRPAKALSKVGKNLARKISLAGKKAM